MGYYWFTMIHDPMHFVKYCEACQFHANFIHQPLEPLHPTIVSWSFEAWGLDLVGPIVPKSLADHAYILVETDYFSKWEDNFANTLMDKLCKKFNFKQYKSSMYNATTNGLVEAFNKTLCNLLKKVVSKTKRDRQEKIGTSTRKRNFILKNDNSRRGPFKGVDFILSLASPSSCRFMASIFSQDKIDSCSGIYALKSPLQFLLF
ncbi:protein NYNRIN-like [Cucumis melo var. makuwa]|uniref:Protein NYNRIN-like n=1 Tax=Cucumis melo var. makuwa TaxID=1194695 RepID=A0A5A7VI35_CUCMM|nr:protein NYNRIN-like [Cucumis melo var. makuwa]